MESTRLRRPAVAALPFVAALGAAPRARAGGDGAADPDVGLIVDDYHPHNTRVGGAGRPRGPGAPPAHAPSAPTPRASPPRGGSPAPPPGVPFCPPPPPGPPRAATTAHRAFPRCCTPEPARRGRDGRSGAPRRPPPRRN